MLENSISDGALYPYRFSRKGGADTDAMLSLLKDYWTAVSQVFREAWELPPRRSRLTHGLGIVSLGYLMDAIADYFGGDRARRRRLRRAPRVGRARVRLDGRLLATRPLPAQLERPPEHAARCAGHRRPPADRLPAGASRARNTDPRREAAAG